jgi:hypothetical protein
MWKMPVGHGRGYSEIQNMPELKMSNFPTWDAKETTAHGGLRNPQEIML